MMVLKYLDVHEIFKEEKRDFPTLHSFFLPSPHQKQEISQIAKCMLV